ncbi:hypothetical protein PV325_011533 [Microctonus aethiopoides]|uniref:c-Myc-binding protein n=1 Tax=Microctonus aethiopoides TaxID=144406 RepID=A0AA39FQ39_9HYME|nr:hypothetical protein PV325_011533 [Microctonus aethiopoides]KAK0095463.1 hypothetical protein PV326_008298 [Microctonus aethiopoides]KAK0173752.1 hypothetical protein PV328_006900 [Microctonus aethiopoides]
MSNYKPNDSKREEFRRYLERSGVLDALTKVLVSLYEEPEKPDDALEYIKKHLGGTSGPTTESENLEKKLQDVEAENRDLKMKLEKLDITDEE